MRRNRPAGRAPFDREQDKNPAASTGCRSCRRQTFGTTAPTGGLHRNRFHRAGRTPVRTGRTRTRHRRRRSGAVAPGAGTATFADETTRAGRAAVRRTKNRWASPRWLSRWGIPTTREPRKPSATPFGPTVVAAVENERRRQPAQGLPDRTLDASRIETAAAERFAQPDRNLIVKFG